MRRWGALLAVVLLALVFGSDGATAKRQGQPHYPDLRTKPPADFRISGTGDARRLFFSNKVWNYGPGPVELRAVNNATTDKTDAYQEIWTHTPEAAYELYEEHHVGTFAFHEAHNHWHLQEFARYELRALNASGGLGPVLRTTDKVSFCVLETTLESASVAHYGWGGAHQCGQGTQQGLKVGYGDLYSSSLPDQFIALTNLPDGNYWLTSTADPASSGRPRGRILETREGNNRAKVKLNIAATSVTKIG